MRKVTCSVLILMLLGCDSMPPPPPRRDAGPADGGVVVVDSGPRDAGDAGDVDAGDVDAGDVVAGDLDAGPIDAGAMDAGFDAGFDAGPDFDGGFDAGTDAEALGLDGSPFDGSLADPCTLIAPGTVCAGSCPAGRTCLENGCGERRCYAAGSPCATASDCPAGSGCTMGACVNPAPGSCTDSRDCPLGFSCDAGACVDRRVRCNPDIPCPQGYYCEETFEHGVGYCFRAHSPCASASGCFYSSAACRDVVGTGTLMCHIATGPNCHTNADCPLAGEVCGAVPVSIEAECGPFGPCATVADCMTGFSCIDLWGDGIRECVPPGSTCARQTDCVAPAICAVPDTGGGARCISRPI